MSNRTPAEVITVPATVAVLDGGVGINWLPSPIPRDIFQRVLFEMLRYAGFPDPRTVTFVRNRTVQGQKRVDYWRLRIEAAECRLHGVDPASVVAKIQRYLRTSHGYTGIEFDVT